MNTQLALFQNPPAVGTVYRVGDLVKLKRRTSHTVGLKKGDIVKIEAIHPGDGSCKFWNEVVEAWGYLYPGEFALLPPSIDSVSKAIAPVEVDTESNPPIDSVSEAIAPVEVDTESNPPIDSVSKAISTYRPKGTARSGVYFRFSYRDGSRMRHIHIRGGNTDSPIAQARVEEVRSLLAAGAKTAQIADMIRKWSIQN